MRRLAMALGLGGAVLLAAAGCSSKGGSGTTGDPWVVGVLEADLADPRLAQQKADLEAAAALEPAVKLAFADAGGDASAQEAQVRDFLAQGVALLLINPVDADAVALAAAAALAKRVPVVALDQKIGDGNYTSFVGSDNARLGEIAGRQVAELVGRRGRVVELKGHSVPAIAQERHEGFLEGLRGWDVQVVLDIDCRGSEEEAKREMAAALGLRPEIDAVFAHTDAMAHGAYLAAKEEGRGREQRIKFVGIGGQPKVGMLYVKEGVLALSVENPTGGAKAVATALRVLRREHVLKDIILGTRIFTEGNVAGGGRPIE